MNLSTIIMPCNYTGATDPESTKGWGTIDFVSEFRLAVSMIDRASLRIGAIGRVSCP